MELYSSLFADDSYRYSLEELQGLFGSNLKFTVGRHVKAENILLVAKLRNKVVGFVSCLFAIRYMTLNCGE